MFYCSAFFRLKPFINDAPYYTTTILISLANKKIPLLWLPFNINLPIYLLGESKSLLSDARLFIENFIFVFKYIPHASVRIGKRRDGSAKIA